MSISGPLYRRSPRLFSKNKPGDWTLVWCELPLEQPEIIIRQEQNGRRLATIPIRECDIAHVRSDGRDCVEITINKTKKETFSSHESSYDVDWWMNTLVSVKRDLELGVNPHISMVCAPTAETPARPKSVRRPSTTLTTTSSNSPNNTSNATIVRPKLRRRQPSLATASLTVFERFTIYETPKTYYIVCSDRHYSRFRMLELNRTIEKPRNLREILKEDVKLYSWDVMEAKLQALAEETKRNGVGKLVRAFTAVAIVGCIRFLRGYYFIFVTQRRKIGNIGGSSIYGIGATQQLNVSCIVEDSSTWTWLNRWFNPSPEEEAEARYLGLFHFLDLTKDFFFSYSYDVTHSLQYNMTTESPEPSEMFTWNLHLTNELKECLSPGAASDLVIPFVLGCYEQRKCSVFGRLISIILLARRSRHFAGTRYLKRGVADTGKAANDVETEQIIEDETMGVGKFSSFVQHRGSIPVFWSQETSATLPKPPIVLNRIDPTYAATHKHFADLFSRYGSPIVALNLVKHSEKKEREVIVGNEYMNAVEYINGFLPREHRVRYVALDYSRLANPRKQNGLNVLHSLDKVAVWALTQTGFFCSAPKRQINSNGNKRSVKAFAAQSSHYSSLKDQGNEKLVNEREPPPSPTIPRNSGDWFEQKGVLRTNCIDCLDRTNVSQFSVGMRALGQQLYAMGIRNTPLLESRSELVRVLMILYSLVGDAISMQYGGSEAHKNVKNSARHENVKGRELLTSIRRYYSNSFTDTAKQDAINMFLGHFIPQENYPPLWELDSDYYLHNFEVHNGKNACEKVRQSLAFHEENKRKAFGDDYHLRYGSQLVEEDDELMDGVEHKRGMLTIRDQEKRDAYIRECKKLLEDWWKEPLDQFERPKIYITKRQPKLILSSEIERDDLSSIKDSDDAPEVSCCGNKANGVSPCSDDFFHMYHPEELTSFDKALGYKFMSPMDLSNELQEETKPRSGSSGADNLTPATPKTTMKMATTARNDEHPSDYTVLSRRLSSKYPGSGRSYRSMSAPDIGEEIERPEFHRKGRDSSREYKAGEDEEPVGFDGRHMSRISLTANSNRFHGPHHHKSMLSLREEDMSVEEYVQNRGHRRFVGDCTTTVTDNVYERYVHWDRNRALWETENESVKMYFESYLRENNISSDDARGLREAQLRGGATFKIQSGPYAGLDQNVKVRTLLAKRLKTDPEDKKIFEDTLDYKKLVQTNASSMPAESVELYKSFFDEELPDVSIFPSEKANTSKNNTGFSVEANKLTELANTFRKASLSKRKGNGSRGVRYGNCDLIPVGPLFKLDGGKDHDFILFNESAAENSFGDFIKNETDLSFLP